MAKDTAFQTKCKAKFYLSPVSASDCMVVETTFMRLKSFMRRSIHTLTTTCEPPEFTKFIKRQVGAFCATKHCDDAIFGRTKHYLEMLVKHKGDLQAIAFAEAGVKGPQEVKMKLLEADLRAKKSKKRQ